MWCLGGEAGKSGWKPTIFIGGSLLPEEEIVSFLSFHPHYCFPIISLHLKGIAGQLYPGPSSWGFSPRRATHSSLVIYDKSKHGLGVRQDEPETNWVHHIDSADALETSGFLVFDLQSSTSMVSSKVLPIGISWDMAFHSAGRMRALGFLSPSAIRSTDEPVPCLHFWRKCGFVCPRNPVFRILLEYLVLGS